MTYVANKKLQTVMTLAMHEAMTALMLVTSRAIKTKLSKEPARTGRLYTKRGGRKHRASAAGEAPAVDTGALRRSWGVRRGEGKWGVRGKGISLTFGSILAYARIDRGWGRVAPRPYVEPSLRIVRPMIEKIAARAMISVLKRGAA